MVAGGVTLVHTLHPTMATRQEGVAAFTHPTLTQDCNIQTSTRVALYIRTPPTLSLPISIAPNQNTTARAALWRGLGASRRRRNDVTGICAGADADSGHHCLPRGLPGEGQQGGADGAGEERGAAGVAYAGEGGDQPAGRPAGAAAGGAVSHAPDARVDTGLCGAEGEEEGEGLAAVGCAGGPGGEDQGADRGEECGAGDGDACAGAGAAGGDGSRGERGEGKS
eukprot:404567-Hanusia_phi.AAC.3